MLLAKQHAVTANGRFLRARRQQTRCSASRTPSEPHIQLATATLPRNTNRAAFANFLYQWAATLTSGGADYPFVLPLKTEKLADVGFQISLMSTAPNRQLVTSADITSTVEAVDDKAVLFVRFYEGAGAAANRSTPAPSSAEQRLEELLNSLVDVPTLMTAMPTAIRQAAQVAATA